MLTKLFMTAAACLLHKIHTEHLDGGSGVTSVTKKPEVIEPRRTAEGKRDSVVTMQALRASAPGAFSVIAFSDGALERGGKVARVLGGRFCGRDRICFGEGRARIMRRRRRRGTGICGGGMRRFGHSHWRSRDFHRAVFCRPRRSLARVIFLMAISESWSRSAA